MSHHSKKSSQRVNSSSPLQKPDLPQTTSEKSLGPEESRGATAASAPASVETKSIITAHQEAYAREKLEAEKAKSGAGAVTEKLHSVVEEALAAIKKTLSGYDPRFSFGILSQLDATEAKDDADGMKLLFAHSILKTVTSGNPIEMMLVIQMIAVHNASIGSARLLGKSSGLDEIEGYGNIFNKLARTFAAQADSLQRLRSGPEPKYHVSVNEGANAILGPVTQNNTVGTSQPGGVTPRLLTDQSGTAMPILGSDDQAVSIAPFIELDHEPALKATGRTRRK